MIKYLRVSDSISDSFEERMGELGIDFRISNPEEVLEDNSDPEYEFGSEIVLLRAKLLLESIQLLGT